LEAEILASRNNLYLAIALGLLGILLIGGYLFQQLRKTRKQLETQNLQLTQLNDTKDRFFGIIAHDIRGPITSLDGIGEQMSYYLKKNNTERLNLLTSQVDKTSKKLTNLLDNLLNWALMQKGTIPYTPQSLDLEEVVQENIELYAEVAAMKNIQLQNKVEKGTLAYADMSAVTTIIRNLVNNAVKFTTDGDTISINTKSEKGKIFIEINDTGTGISANKLEKIFLLNTERKQGTSGEKGSGLGLLLCKDLVKLNKGTIKAVSELGKGSTFIFSLPIV
jgi:signal transduction histidine kinase